MMETFALWLLKSAAWLTGFALVYFIFLRNERFFMLKRIYLISGIVISIIIPIFSFHYKVEVANVQNMIRGIQELGSASPAQALQTIPRHLDYRIILLVVYISGMTFLLIKTISNFKGLFSTIKKFKKTNSGPVRLVRAPEFRSSFSFFNYVFINPSISEEEASEIMNHEMVHVRQHHWFDLLLVEILRMVQWVNPFAWIYTGFIRLNHEYLADQAALQRSVSPAVYRAALMNQLFDSQVISLSNSFNYSLNKKRFDMMKQKLISPWRKLKVILILPVIAVIFYAFETPKYVYTRLENSANENGSTIQQNYNLLTDNQLSSLQQDTVKKKVLKNQSPKSNLSVPPPPAPDKQPEEAGKGVVAVVMETPLQNQQDTAKGKIPPKPTVFTEPRGMVVFIDGVYTDKSPSDAFNELGHNLGMVNPLPAEQAIKKYGEKGSKGVLDIITRKRAQEMGMNVPYNRTGPDDFPTFMGQKSNSFPGWLISQLKYPKDALSANVSGTVGVTFKVNLDGSLSEIQPRFSRDKTLEAAVVTAIASSPRWDPPKNKEISDPFNVSVTIKFEMPDKIYVPEEPFVVVEEMPMYKEGGDVGLLKYIRENTKYPEYEKTNRISGRVIIRFVVSANGKAEDASVLKGVSPGLDAEALRVVNSLPEFKPGMQGGKPVPVYYMVPITFSLDSEKKEAGTKDNSGMQEPYENPQKKAMYLEGEDAMNKILNGYVSVKDKTLKKGEIYNCTVKIIVTKLGKVSDPRIVQSDNEIISKDVLERLKKLGDFSPAMQDGKAVDSYLTLSFALKRS
jgi:TonB family protein